VDPLAPILDGPRVGPDRTPEDFALLAKRGEVIRTHPGVFVVELNGKDPSFRIDPSQVCGRVADIGTKVNDAADRP
jgi:hypothetical protein